MVAAGDPVRDRLYERAGELVALASALSAAEGGTGTTVVLLGAAGIGKTQLLRCAVDSARSRGFQVLVARADEAERGFPFSVVLQLFEGTLRRLSEADRARVLEGAAGLATRLLEPSGLAGAAAFAEQLFPLIHGLSWLTANLAERAPLVIAVDDVHTSDEPSARFLLYLAQRLSELPVMLLVSARSSEPDAAAEVRELVSLPEARVLRPAPLTAEALRSLIADHLGFAVSEEFVSACLEVTGGNPFLVNELLAALETEGIDECTARADRVRALTPDAVTQRLLVRIMRLPDAAATLVRAASVLGDGTPLRIAAALAEIDLELAAKAVDALAAVEILRPVCGGERVEFLHPLLRAAIYADQPAGERARMHARAASLLVAEGASLEQIVPQLLPAQRGVVPESVDLLVKAARAARARGATQATAGFLERALEEPVDAPSRAQLLLELATVRLAAGDFEAAQSSARAAVAASRDPEQAARAQLVIGRALYAAARHLDAAQAFQAGLDQLGGAECELSYELRAGYATAASLDASLAPQGVAMAEVIVKERSEDPTLAERSLLAQLAAKRGFAATEREGVRALAEQAWNGGRLLEEEGPGGTVWSLVTAALVCADYLERSVEICSTVLDAARTSGSLLGFANASYCRTLPLLKLGHVDEAIADAEAAIAARGEGWEQHLGSASAMLAHALIEKGELASAAGALAPIDEPAMKTRVDYALLLAARARLAMARGDAATALRDAAAARHLLVDVFAMRAPIFDHHPTEALAAAAIGDDDQARETAEEMLALAQSIGAPGMIGSALRLLALVERGERRLGLLAEAVSVLQPLAPRLEFVRVLVDYGAALRRADQRRAAREPLQRALEHAVSGGALALAEHARVELAALGARPRKDVTARDRLTASERRVAQMAASGMTNKQIAQALFVTLKAVEGHLHHAYRKLGICSRDELGAALEHGAEPSAGSAIKHGTPTDKE